MDPAQFRPPKGATPAEDTKPFIFFNQLEARLRATAGIESVGAVSALPLNPVGTDYDCRQSSREGPPAPRGGTASRLSCGHGQLLSHDAHAVDRRTRIHGIRRPRHDASGDHQRHAGPTDICGENPVGKRLILYGRPREIVGVVGSVRHHGFTRDPRPEMVLPYRQFQFTGMTLVVRSAIEPSAVAEAIRDAVQSLDPQQPVYRVRALDGCWPIPSRSHASPRCCSAVRGAGSRACCRRRLRRHVIHRRSARARDRCTHDAWSAAE